jgi:hypothetical protein
VAGDRRVYRSVIDLNGDGRVTLDATGPIVHVGSRHEDQVEIWHLHQQDVKPTPVNLAVYGTGYPIGGDAVDHLGSVITPSGRLVWHVFRCL